MISEMEAKGYKRLVATTPTGITKMFGARAQTMGIQMTPAVKEYLRQLLQEYVKYYCEFIPSLELLEEFMMFDAKNTDKAMAFGIALIYLKDDKRVIYNDKDGDLGSIKFGYRMVNGKVTLYTDKVTEKPRES
jgi:hypothetical protein